MEKTPDPFDSTQCVKAMKKSYVPFNQSPFNQSGFNSWSDIACDDQPIQFWFSVILHFVASVSCLVGLVFVLKYGFS
jgi:hypothetical protein